jgi:hypothetical protein
MYPRGYINVIVIHVVLIRIVCDPLYKMPKWKKDQKEFKVSVTYHEHRGCQAYLPRPIMELLGTPGSIRFILRDNGKVEVRSGD